mgnify:CR=1 FL=1
MKQILYVLGAFMLIMLQPLAAQTFEDHLIFTQNTARRGIHSLEHGDIDNDGDQDLLIVRDIPSGFFQVLWQENLGNGNFSNQQTTIRESPFGGDYRMRGAKFIDANQDNNLDILVVEYTAENIVIILGNGDGSFQPPIVVDVFDYLPVAFNVIDFDGDGIEDIIIADPDTFSPFLHWYKGRGNALFDPIEALAPCGLTTDIEFADIDGDNNIDIVTGNSVIQTGDGAVAYFRSNGNGEIPEPGEVLFRPPGNVIPTDILIDDFNNDGDPDIVYASRGQDNVGWYSSDGAGNFSFKLEFPELWGCDGLSTGDINQDGFKEIVYGTFGTPATGEQAELILLTNNAGVNFTRSLITDDVRDVKRTQIVDLDNDGDLDVASFGSINYRTMWHETTLSQDNDGDGVFTPEDSDDTNPFVCRDLDADGCDDCSQTGADGSGGDVANDGTDTDADGQCNIGDTDDDNDGNPDNTDPNPQSVQTNPDAGTTPENRNIIIDILANDDFLPGNNTSITDAGTGTATGTISFNNVTGELDYLPNAGEATMTVTVNYTVCHTPTGVCETETVTITVDPALSVNDPAKNLFKVYPNPVNHQVTIDTKEPLKAYQLFNLLGQKILTGSLERTQTIDLSALVSGVYMLHIKGDNNQAILKIVKK